MNGIILLLCGLLPSPEPVDVRVDQIQVNHFYDDKGVHTFTQIIFTHGGDVVAWRLIREWDFVRPHFPIGGKHGYQTTWIDRSGGIDTLIRVRGLGIVENWTQHDPELLSREKLARELRRGLEGRP